MLKAIYNSCKKFTWRIYALSERLLVCYGTSWYHDMSTCVSASNSKWAICAICVIQCSVLGPKDLQLWALELASVRTASRKVLPVRL